MTDRTYKFSLLVHGKVAYESTIERSNPQDALAWGFYWLPSHWIQRGPCDCAPIHARICVLNGDGTQKPWKHYDSDYLENVSHISDFCKKDLICLLRGQHIVWTSDECDGKLFHTYESCKDYLFDKRKIFKHGTMRHIWVDGWYDEQYSWRSDKVKGYEIAELKEVSE